MFQQLSFFACVFKVTRYVKSAESYRNAKPCLWPRLFPVITCRPTEL